MGRLLIALAGLLSVGLTFAHVAGGGVDVHIPILESELTDLLKGYVSVVWHGVTATLILCSILLFLAARYQHYRVILTSIVVAQYAAFIAIFLFYGIVRFQSLFLMPPWIGFSIIVIVALAGLWIDHRNAEKESRS